MNLNKVWKFVQTVAYFSCAIAILDVISTVYEGYIADPEPGIAPLEFWAYLGALATGAILCFREALTKIFQ